MRRKLGSPLLVALALGGIIGCTPTTDAPTPSGTQAHAPAPFEGVVGADWTTHPLPEALRGADIESVAIGAGAIWVLATTDELVLASTRDGEAWEVSPLSELGLPAGTLGSGHVIARGDEVAIVLDNTDSVNRTNVYPDSAEVQPVPHVLRFDGEGWSAHSPENSATWDETGIPHDLHYVGAIAAGFAGDAVVAVAKVRWFPGGSDVLVDASLASVAVAGDDTVRLVSPYAPPLAGVDVQDVHAAVSDPDRLHVVGDIFVRAEDTWRAAVWSSADGVTWEQSFVGVEPTDRTEATSAVVVGDALVVAIARGVPDSFDKVGELVVRDAGGTWSRIPHPAGEKLLTLATDGASLYAFGGALGAPTSIWVSHDLETWQKLSDRSGMPPAKTWRDSGNPSPQVFSYPGGIAYLEGITRPSLVVSGPPPWSTTGDE